MSGQHIEGVTIIKGYYSKQKSEDLLEYYLGLEYEQREIKMGGRLLKTPRLMRVIGDKGTVLGGYSTIKDDMLDWDEQTLQIKEELAENANAAAINRYRDGHDYIGYHSDKEVGEYGIVGLSLGATRSFLFKNIETKKVIKYELEAGDVIYITSEANKIWMHSVPKRLKVKDVRISITFRHLQMA